MSEYGAGKNGFTPAQLKSLRHQIVVYKKLKTYRNGEVVEPSDLAAAVPPPLKRLVGPQSSQAEDQGASSTPADASPGEIAVTPLDQQQNMRLSNETVMHGPPRAEQTDDHLTSPRRDETKSPQAGGGVNPSSKDVEEAGNGETTAKKPLFLHAQVVRMKWMDR